MKSCSFLLAIIFGGTLTFSVPALTKSAHPEHLIVIENMMFRPNDLTAAAGDKVTWINKDLVPHTVTALNKTFDSKMIDPGKSWSYHVRKKGNISYKCSFHPTMSATLQVK